MPPRPSSHTTGHAGSHPAVPKRPLVRGGAALSVSLLRVHCFEVSKGFHPFTDLGSPSISEGIWRLPESKIAASRSRFSSALRLGESLRCWPSSCSLAYYDFC